MTSDNQLHTNPTIKMHSHPSRSAIVKTAQQRNRTTTIYKQSQPNRRAFITPKLNVPKHKLPKQFHHTKPTKLPKITKPEIVHHYNQLSKRNFNLNTNFYPLGSCTMKHNPKLHERVTTLPNNAHLHPLQDPSHTQNTLQLI